MREIDEIVIPYFKDAAKQLLEEYGQPELALARALAKITGFTQLNVSMLHLPSLLLAYHLICAVMFLVEMARKKVLTAEVRMEDHHESIWT